MMNVDPTRLVFIDESGFNIAMSSAFGWGPIGERLIEHKPANWGDNLSVIGAIHVEGVLCHQTIRGAVNTDTFVGFVRKILCPRLSPGQIVVLDNLNAHKAPTVRAAIEQVGAELILLPPYSPDLNPIELMWSSIKRAARAVAARSVAAVKQLIRSALRRQPQAHFASWFSHCGYHPQSNGERV
jgi:transposase